MAASRIVVRFTRRSLGALRAALVAHAERLNSLLKPSWPDAEKVQNEMYELVNTLMVHGVDQKCFTTFAQIEGVEEMVTTQEICAVSWGSLFCVSVIPFQLRHCHQRHRQRGMQLLVAFMRLIQNMS
jgi:hypothetical protein